MLVRKHRFPVRVGPASVVYYVATHPAMHKGRPVSKIEPQAIVLRIGDGGWFARAEKRAVLQWRGSGIAGEALGRLEFSHVRFLTQPPDSAKFKKQADARRGSKAIGRRLRVES
jgi:hypothetical protein